MENCNENGYSIQSAKTYWNHPFDSGGDSVKTKIKNKYQIKSGQIATTANLPEHRLFNKKNSEIYLKFLPFLEKVSFQGNDSIYQPGDSIDYLYFPESSIFSEFQILEDGATVEIAMTGSEGIVGLSSIFDNNQATNWTQVSAAGNALKIKSKILREEASFNPNLQQFLYSCIGSYIKQISQRSVCNNCHTLEKRLCCWLLMMQDRLKNPKLPLTQEKMARILGANRPSITYIAQNLREFGIIDYRRGILIIKNRTELENRSCGCFAEIDRKLENIF